MVFMDMVRELGQECSAKCLDMERVKLTKKEDKCIKECRGEIMRSRDLAEEMLSRNITPEFVSQFTG